jgi:anti-anti-sigma factor
MRDRLAELSFETTGNVVVGRVVGEIESINAQEMSTALASRLTSEVAGLVIDLTRVSYLDSAGIELLFDLARRLRTHRQRLRLVVPADSPMRRVLELCDMDRAAPIDATVEGALDGFGEPPAPA